MKPVARALLLAGLHLGLVATLGGKLLLDRLTRPRCWVKVGPVDPSLPIRGRYAQRLEESAAAGRKDADYALLRQTPEGWVEVTVPSRGPLRPIRLGVVRKGRIEPLTL